MNSQQLKLETQHLHQQLEQEMQSHLLFTPNYTKEMYVQFLLNSHAYLQKVTQQQTIFWDEYQSLLVQKLIAIEKDLLELQIPIQQITSLNYLPTKYEQLGYIYLSLGAMLGNKMIVKALSSNPNFGGYSFYYLTEHQDKIGEIWPRFQQQINALTTEQLEEVIAGASWGYAIFNQ